MLRLNLRHKVVAFVTLVVVGLALVQGARLREALGIALLGIALAWALGSKALADAFNAAANTAPSMTRPAGRALNSVPVLLIIIAVAALVIVERFDSPVFLLIAVVALASAFLFRHSKLSGCVRSLLKFFSGPPEE